MPLRKNGTFMQSTLLQGAPIISSSLSSPLSAPPLHANCMITRRAPPHSQPSFLHPPVLLPNTFPSIRPPRGFAAQQPAAAQQRGRRQPLRPGHSAQLRERVVCAVAALQNGFQVRGTGGCGFRVWGFRVWGFRVCGFRAWGFRAWGFRVWGFSGGCHARNAGSVFSGAEVQKGNVE